MKPRYQGQREFEHGRKPRLGVVLVNLGTPESPTPAAVRCYLAEFLSGPRVVEIPRLVWKVILHGIIPRVRPKKTAHACASVWTDEGSPMRTTSLALTQRVEEQLARSVSGPIQLCWPETSDDLDSRSLENTLVETRSYAVATWH